MTKIKQHLTTILIALTVSSLAGGAGAFAAQRLTFNDIDGRLAGARITRGSITKQHLEYPLRAEINVLENDAASNTATNQIQVNAQMNTWRSIQQLKRELREAGVPIAEVDEP